jgi:hypothetical protein
MPPKILDFLKDLAGATVITLVLPLCAIALDYRIRSKSVRAPFSKLIRRTGHDCCAFSLGVAPAIFMDPNLRNLKDMTSPLVVLGLAFFLFWMRIECINAADPLDDSPEGLKWGVRALLAVFFVMAYGYAAAKGLL